MKSVLQDWVMELPLREQGVLLTAVRGCDVAPKPLTPEDMEKCAERRLVAFVRYCFLNPADPREVDKEPGCWFRSSPPENFRASQIMHYPLHWYCHIMHALEIIKVRSPIGQNALYADIMYNLMVHALHLEPESAYTMINRLSEDRIAKGTVVS